MREGPPEVNPWGVTFKTLFHMSNDSHLFRTRAELDARGLWLDANGRFRGNGEQWLPLYEAKMIHQYDHRFATYEGGPADDKARDLTPEEHADPNCVALPRYWLEGSDVANVLLKSSAAPEWLFGFRKTARATDVRTLIAAIVPPVAVNDKLQLVMGYENAKSASMMLAAFNSIALDFVVRQKAGGTDLSFFIIKQLPMLSTGTVTPALLDQIVPRVVELVYTAHDMAPFARDCGYDGPPSIWDEERRAHLRAELDGIYAHLYGLARDDFAYILDQFPIVRRNDEKTFGEFRTKRLCLDAFNALTALQA